MSPSDGKASPVLALSSVSFQRAGRRILESIDWEVSPAEHWVVLGANGCGKTTLSRIATMWEHPSSGDVTLLDEHLGSVDVRRLRRRVALVSAAMADMVRPSLSAVEVVVCARFAALEPWWHTYTEADFTRAASLLADQGLAGREQSRFATLSSGERQRVLLARALMGDPEFIVLDEPSAGLDLGGREVLLARLDHLARQASSPPTVLVTHHVEEIPPSFTHLLALREGRVLAAGPLRETLNSDLLSRCFDIDVELTAHPSGAGFRYAARAVD